MHKKMLIALMALAISACSKQADVVTSTGEKINLSDLHGKWLVVNYWAEWCTNCKVDIRDFDRFHHAYQDQVMVLGVNFDGVDNKKLNQLKHDWHIEFPLTAHFPIDKYGVKHIETLPRTYIFSPDGKLQKTLHGPQTVRMLASAINVTEDKS